MKWLVLSRTRFNDQIKKHFRPYLQMYFGLSFVIRSSEMDVETRSKRDLSQSLWFRWLHVDEDSEVQFRYFTLIKRMPLWKGGLRFWHKQNTLSRSFRSPDRAWHTVTKPDTSCITNKLYNIEDVFVLPTQTRPYQTTWIQLKALEKGHLCPSYFINKHVTLKVLLGLWMHAVYSTVCLLTRVLWHIST